MATTYLLPKPTKILKPADPLTGAIPDTGQAGQGGGTSVDYGQTDTVTPPIGYGPAQPAEPSGVVSSPIYHPIAPAHSTMLQPQDAQVGQGDAQAAAPTDTSAAVPTQASAYASNNQYLPQIASIMKAAFGRDPTDAEVNQWGGNIDANYFNTIRQAILNSPEAKAYAASKAAGTTPTVDPKQDPAADGTNWATADYSNPATVDAYFRSRGVTPRAGSAEYWAQKYNSPEMNGDRAYFFQRLSTAEDFGGGGGSAGGGAYASNQTSPYTDQIRKLLFDRIAKDSEDFNANTDPGVSNAMAGAKLTADVQGEMERRALGEQLFAGGNLGNGLKDQQVQQSNERTAASLSTLKGTLVLKEIDARRTDLTNLLNMAIQSGDNELARQTQIALANLQAMLTREGYGWDAAKYSASQTAATTKAGTGG